MGIVVPRLTGTQVQRRQLEGQQTPLGLAGGEDIAVGRAVGAAARSVAGDIDEVANAQASQKLRDDRRVGENLGLEMLRELDPIETRLASLRGDQALPAANSDDPAAFKGVSASYLEAAGHVKESYLKDANDQQKQFALERFELGLRTSVKSLSNHEATQRFHAEVSVSEAAADQARMKAIDSSADLDDTATWVADGRATVLSSPKHLTREEGEVAALEWESGTWEEIIKALSVQDWAEAQDLAADKRESGELREDAFARLTASNESERILQVSQDIVDELWGTGSASEIEAQIRERMDDDPKGRKEAIRLFRANVTAFEKRTKAAQRETNRNDDLKIADFVEDGDFESAWRVVNNSKDGAWALKRRATLERLQKEEPAPPVVLTDLNKVMMLAYSDNPEDHEKFLDTEDEWLDKFSDGTTSGGRHLTKLYEIKDAILKGEPVKNRANGRSRAEVLGDAIDATFGELGFGRTRPIDASQTIQKIGVEYDLLIEDFFEREKRNPGAGEYQELVERAVAKHSESSWKKWTSDRRNYDYDGDLTTIDPEFVKSVADLPVEAERQIRAEILRVSTSAGRPINDPSNEYILEKFKSMRKKAALQ